jgi:hypothetical protein
MFTAAAAAGVISYLRIPDPVLLLASLSSSKE